MCLISKEKEVQVRQKMDEIKGKLTDKSQEILTKWEEKSRDFIGSFIDMFGRDGRLVSLMKSFSTTNIFQDENNNKTDKDWVDMSDHWSVTSYLNSIL